MGQEGIWGWDADNSRWVKILVDSTGRLIIDPSAILENPPTEDESAKAPTSEWAFDHEADADAHHEAFTPADHTAIGDLAPHHAEAHTLASHTTKAHSELTGVGSSDHHVRYADSEAVTAMGVKADSNPLNHDRYTDTLAVAAAKTVKLDDFAAPDNNTDLNASAAAHGLLPKLSDVATEFLNGQGAFSTPAGAGGIKVKAETRDMTAASGDVSYTGYGFTPTGLIIFAYNTSNIASIGDSDPAKVAMQISIITGSVIRASAVIVNLFPSSGANQTAIVKSYGDDGFTLTWTKAGSPTGTGYLTVFAFK